MKAPLRVPFVGGSYELARKKADVQRSINLCPTPIESGGGKVPMFLESVPGLTAFAGFDLRVTDDLEDRITEDGQLRYIN